MPAAASRWPTLVLAEPTRSGRSSARPGAVTAPTARASTGSPTAVPVPCSSRYWRSAGSMPARRQAARSAALWVSSPGVVSPGVAPSLLTALPRITQYTGSPSASAADSGFRTTRAPPSPRTIPLARASKTWQRASGESAPRRARARVLSGIRFRLTPPASAVVDSPPRRLAQAACTATSEEDWAVSRVMLGPRRPRAWLTRLAMMPRWVPVTLYWLMAGAPYSCSSLA